MALRATGPDPERSPELPSSNELQIVTGNQLLIRAFFVQATGMRVGQNSSRRAGFCTHDPTLALVSLDNFVI
jgi:hypothetical protein